MTVYRTPITLAFVTCVDPQIPTPKGLRYTKHFRRDEGIFVELTLFLSIGYYLLSGLVYFMMDAEKCAGYILLIAEPKLRMPRHLRIISHTHSMWVSPFRRILLWLKIYYYCYFSNRDSVAGKTQM